LKNILGMSIQQLMWDLRSLDCNDELIIPLCEGIVVFCDVGDISASMPWVEHLGEPIVKSVGQFMTLWQLPFPHRKCDQ
jgi:hypothetical protein